MKQRRQRRDAGWALLTVLFMSALIVISLTRVMPRAAFETQRDREDDLMFRGKDYQRAIQLYFRKFRKFPARVEELENTNQIRFLRRRWIDPMTGKDEWRFLHIGPAGVLVDSVLQAPPSVAGAAGATGGPAPAGTIGGPGSPATPGLVGTSPGGQPASGFGQPSSGFGQPSSGFGQPSSGFGQQPARPGLPGPTPGPGVPTSGFNPQLGGAGQPTMGLPTTVGIGTTVGGTTSGFVTPGAGGASFGTGIAGVASKSEKKSIKLYNGRQQYNEWEFVYDFRRDPVMMQQAQQGVPGQGVPGQPGMPGQPGVMQPGQPGGFGQQPGQPSRPGFGQPGFGQPGTGLPGFGQQPRPTGPPR